MFSSLRNFLYRHRRKFIASGIIVGGAVLLTRYAHRALQEWREKEMKEFLERTRKQQHYDSSERTCNQVALTLISTMKETIAKLIPTDETIEELKKGSGNKVALWQKLKLMAFAKVTLVIYLSSLLMVSLRLQFNLISGYIFRDMTEEKKNEITSDLQEKYLSLCQYLLKDGAVKLYEVVYEKVTLVLSKKSLKEQLTIKDVEQILWAVHSSVSKDPRNPCQHLASYIIPPDAEDANLPDESVAAYKRILTETSDLLESEEVISLCNSCVTRGLSYIIDNIAEYYSVEPKPSTSAAADSFFTANMTAEGKLFDFSCSIALAKVIPIVNGLVVNQASTTDLSYTWMQQLILMDNLKVMGANVYETFSVK